MECYFLSTMLERVECFKDCAYYEEGKENPIEECPFAQVFKGKTYDDFKKEAVNN